MEQKQELKQPDQSENSKVLDIYVGPWKGKWCVSEVPDIFGEPFYTREQAIAEAKRRANEHKQKGVTVVIKVYNEATQQYEVIS
jgi:hypothetical protein